jgi:hypothetical protein
MPGTRAAAAGRRLEYAGVKTVDLGGTSSMMQLP